MPYIQDDDTRVCHAYSEMEERASPTDGWNLSDGVESVEKVVARKWRNTSTTPGYSGGFEVVQEAKSFQYHVLLPGPKGGRYVSRTVRFPAVKKRKTNVVLKSLPFSAGGFRIEGSYSWEERGLKSTGGDDPVTYLGLVRRWYGDLAMVAGRPNLDGYDPVMFDRLALRLADKAGRGEFDAPLFLAEARQTATMVTSIAERLRRGVSSLARGRFFESIGHLFPDLYNWSDTGFPRGERSRKARYYDRRIKTVHRKWEAGTVDPLVGPARAASSAWLELQFGVLQILEDAHAFAEYLAERQVARGDDGRYTKISVSTKVKVVENAQGGRFTMSPEIWGVRGSVRENSYRLTVTYKVGSQGLRDLKEFGLTNPLLLAANLTKLSWVVDWFSPITGYLGQFDAYLGLEFVDGSQGYSVDEVVNYMTYDSRGGPRGSSVGWSVSRQPLSSFPYASAAVLKPRPTEMGYWKVATSVALLAQALTGLGGKQ